MSGMWSNLAARGFRWGWELRRRAYAAGLVTPVRAGARVVSIGNLTVGGTGKTTCVLHLARRALDLEQDVGVVCRRYRPGPGGFGDEERLFEDRLGAERVYAGRSKARLAIEAAKAGRTLVIVDDGFSHWRLHRDLDVLLIDASDPWGGGALLPAGRMREPFRAIQRARAIVVTRCPDPEPADLLARIARLAPAARIATARHRVTAVDMRGLAPPMKRRAWLVTATGNPDAVERTARTAGIEIAGTSAYRDHHWFSDAEARAEAARAAGAGGFLLLTAKDAVRWPAAGGPAAVLEVAWEWGRGGDAVERLVFGTLEGTS
jgi:tetraacyldisaccharide 4'-kinase